VLRKALCMVDSQFTAADPGMPTTPMPLTVYIYMLSNQYFIARFPFSTRPNIFEPVWSAILPLKPWLSSIKLTGFATVALGTVGAIVEWDVVVADVFEPVFSFKLAILAQLGLFLKSDSLPMDFRGILKQP
jgi:hypothetical protein